MTGIWEREFPVTRRLLRAFPADLAEYRPHELARSARELGWQLAVSFIHATDEVLGGASEFFPHPITAPESWREVLEGYDDAYHRFANRLRGLPEGALEEPIRVPVERDDIRNLPRSGVLWLALHDSIHHRGQFSVYVRLAGGKVPSIYGPTADEPWG